MRKPLSYGERNRSNKMQLLCPHGSLTKGIDWSSHIASTRRTCTRNRPPGRRGSGPGQLWPLYTSYRRDGVAIAPYPGSPSFDGIACELAKYAKSPTLRNLYTPPLSVMTGGTVFMPRRPLMNSRLRLRCRDSRPRKSTSRIPRRPMETATFPSNIPCPSPVQPSPRWRGFFSILSLAPARSGGPRFAYDFLDEERRQVGRQ